ncbi:hypothetical protein [Nocardiopsis eucommiae]|uniref:hypothetical protein n=1 Tax=Nocardiopsis eucommiae TaxID=2831970 RepID=UPI003D730320
MLAMLLAFPLAMLPGDSLPAHADSDNEEEVQQDEGDEDEEESADVGARDGGARGGDSGGEEDELDSLSFYRLSSSMTALFSTAQEPGNTIELGGNWEALIQNPASSGSMLGYPDEQYNILRGWIDSRNAQSSNDVGYGSLVGAQGSGFDHASGARNYALFGASLNGLGLDSTSSGLALGFSSWMMGGIVLILFMVAAAIDSLWSIILSTLILLNPFRLIYDGVQATSGQNFADNMTGGQGGSDTNWLTDNFVALVGYGYGLLVGISWAVLLPVFLGVFVMGLLLFKRMDRGAATKKFLIRFVFISVGVPIIGAMYSGVLNSMQEATNEGNSAATEVVFSTFLDFESWAMRERLRVPSGAVIEWDVKDQAPSGDSQIAVRDTALLINANSLGFSEGRVRLSGEEATWGSDMLAGDSSTYEDSHYAAVSDMLNRYMNVHHVNAASFESESKSTVAAEDMENATSWFDEYMERPSSLQDLEDAQSNPLLSVAPDSGLTANREMASGENRSDKIHFISERGTQAACGRKIADTGGVPAACNLAPLAMYNYLNTDFGPTSYTSYSSGKSTSEATRYIHNSVNLVGTGIMSFIYWIHAVVLLGAFVVIGLGYSLGLLMANIRRTFQLIGSIPFAVVGVVSGIAKFIIYTVAMIMEILVTIFLYKLVLALLLAMPEIISAPFSGALTGNEAPAPPAFVEFLQQSGFLHMVVTLVSIVAVILFTIMAMRVRKTLVKAVEDGVTKAVEKFVDSKAQTPPNTMRPHRPGSGKASAAGGNRSMNGARGMKNPKGLKGANAGGTNAGAAAAGLGAGAGAAAMTADNNTKVSGDVNTDGKLEADDPAMAGGGSSGSGLEPSAQERNAAGEAELGRRVERDGLSDDPMKAMGESARQSAAGYAEADRQRLGAAKDGVAAAGYSAMAVGRGVVGDKAGAVESAGKAAERRGSAMSRNAEASRTAQQAGRSSLDRPQSTPRLDRRVQKGQQISDTGRNVSDVAGAVGGVSGGAPKPAQPQPTPKKPPSAGGGTPPRNRRRGPKRK